MIAWSRLIGLVICFNGACLAQFGEVAGTAGLNIQSGQKVVLSVPRGGRGQTFRWFASAGQFIGIVNRESVTYVAAGGGPADVVNVMEYQNATIVRNIRVNVAFAPQSPTRGPIKDQVQPGADVGQLGFIPSNWMGDGERQNGFKVQPTSDEKPHSPPFCQKWEYRPVPSSGGGLGWGAVGWAFPANNWGDRPGKAGLAGKGYSEVSFWVRGVPDKSGRFPVIQFKTGGNTDPSKRYQASYEAETDFITLTAEWERHAIPIGGKDLTSVISAFTFVLRAEDNPNGAVFFLDDIEFR